MANFRGASLVLLLVNIVFNIAAIGFFIYALTAGSTANASIIYTAKHCQEITEYDGYFRWYTRVYLPRDYPWLLLKSQGCQESLLDNDAVSNVGALTIMQFMPATWQEEASKFGSKMIKAKTARNSIKLSAIYMAKLRKGWKTKRPENDRRALTWCSYNWGFGNCLQAQSKAGGTNLYAPLIPFLPDETREYVDRILLIYEYWGVR